MQGRFALLVCGLLVVSSGCASARYVSKSSVEGVIAMPSTSEANREKAHELMARHFPDGYVIDCEQEEVVGERTSFSHHGDKMMSATTQDKKEWRIHYRRKNAEDFGEASANTDDVRTVGFATGG